METIPTPKEPEALVQELLSRGKFYKKGFGVLIQGLVCDLDLFYEEGMNQEEKISSMRSTINQMRNIYEQMLIDGLKESPDADLLLNINQKINELTDEVEKIILTKTTTDKAIEILKAIFRPAQEFRKRLHELLNELRTHSGYERWSLRGQDVFGRDWSSFGL